MNKLNFLIKSINKKGGKNNLFILVSWVLILLYLISVDFNCFILFLVLPPIFGGFLYIAVKRRHIALSIFFILVFISQAINPAFFYLNKNLFLDSSTWPVQNFSFDIFDFFNEYKYMYALISLIFVFTILLHRLMSVNEIKSLNQHGDISDVNPKFRINFDAKGNKVYSNYLWILILFIALPLCLFMYNNKIGISTIEPNKLPFKLVGITIYTRMLIIPALIFLFYYKSNKTFLSTFLILFYALIVGLLSLSKGMLLLTLLPVILFSYLDKNNLRLYFVLSFGAVLYMIISEFRQIILLSNISPLDMIQSVILLLKSDASFNSDQNLISTFLFAFSDRLYGAQYTLMSNQFVLENNIPYVFNFILSNTESLSKIITFELFGLAEQSDAVIGVNIGYLNIILVLAQHNILIILLLAFFTSICLTVAEVLLVKYYKGNETLKVVGYVLCFNMIYFLYDGFISKFYLIICLSIACIFFIRLLNNFKFRR